ncbi:hypothetical protein KP509_27G016100 [Ceratopteris richardii]|uniref:Uncharacterized protein n=1 Tax=Ceratopteris richardii TaxID=49495 RepID=A0A8T2RFK6_CERRI|nr:hypothetical protein KP509_27G016100 [Ceratopteris richardii]
MHVYTSQGLYIILAVCCIMSSVLQYTDQFILNLSIYAEHLSVICSDFDQLSEFNQFLALICYYLNIKSCNVQFLWIPAPCFPFFSFSMMVLLASICILDQNQFA